MDELNRRDFAGMLAALLGAAAMTTQAEGQTAGAAPRADEGVVVGSLQAAAGQGDGGRA